MKKPFSTGDLVILVTATNPLCHRYIGQIHKLGRLSDFYLDAWRFDPPVFQDGLPVSWNECDMRPIRDQPGNESWFTAAPKSLPATTKGDTITERGELA